MAFSARRRRRASAAHAPRRGSKGKQDMDLKHFFDGQQSRENSASAFLATLLEYDDEFRRRFLALAHVAPPLDDTLVWAVKVEDTEPWTTPIPDVEAGAGAIDITMESTSTVVLIENKLTPSAKRNGQLRRYYVAATGTWREKRIVALYLAPTLHFGESEVDLVKRCDVFESREARPAGADDAGCVSWSDVLTIIEDQPSEGRWFAITGINAVQVATDEARRILSTEGQRGAVHDVVQAARTSLAASIPGVRFGPWRGRLYDLIYTAKAPITMYLGTHFAAESIAPFRVVNVVGDDGRLRLTVNTTFALSPTGRKSQALVREWAGSAAAGRITSKVNSPMHLTDGGIVPTWQRSHIRRGGHRPRNLWTRLL